MKKKNHKEKNVMKGENNMRKHHLFHQVTTYIKDLLSNLTSNVNREKEMFMASNDYIRE